MNTETQTTEKPLSLEHFFLQQMCDKQKGLRVDVTISGLTQDLTDRRAQPASAYFDALELLVRHKTMSALLAATHGTPVPVEADASFFPVLWPAGVDADLAQDIDLAREHAATRCAGTAEHLFDGETMGEIIADAIQSPPDNWYFFWTDFIACQFGVDHVGESPLDSLLALGKVLRERDAPPLVFIAYAPELVFNDTSNPAERDALISMLAITDWVNALYLHERQHAILFAGREWLDARDRELGTKQ